MINECGVVNGRRICKGNWSIWTIPNAMERPPEIPHDLTWDLAWSAMVETWPLTAWDVAWPAPKSIVYAENWNLIIQPVMLLSMCILVRQWIIGKGILPRINRRALSHIYNMTEVRIQWWAFINAIMNTHTCSIWLEKCHVKLRNSHLFREDPAHEDHYCS